uniref:Zinc metalloproteinase n=1 Tax=Strongyloides venezuelensis TaxID=75913 RepID=A0A0K0FHA1_STRVS
MEKIVIILLNIVICISSNLFYENIISRKQRKVSFNLDHKWPLPIPYFIDINVNVAAVEKVIKFIQQESCIRFKRYPTKVSGIVGLHYYYGNDCSSSVGKKVKRSWQKISIGENCDKYGKIYHETLHALGFYHEHTRLDRDKYIKLLFRNVIPNFASQFAKVSKTDSNTFRIPYDYGSVMHYALFFLSSNGENTMVPYDKLYDMTPGYKSKMSFNDLKLLNIYYCSTVCKNKIKCYNFGFPDSNNCGKCKCVNGFTGLYCNIMVKSSIQCGETQYFATKVRSKFEVKGARDCVYHFLTSRFRKLKVKIESTSLYPNFLRFCYDINSVEIKYRNDKSVTGALFCNYNSDITIVSHGNHVMIRYRSDNPKNRVLLNFQSVSRLYRQMASKSPFMNGLFKKIGFNRGANIEVPF